MVDSLLFLTGYMASQTCIPALLTRALQYPTKAPRIACLELCFFTT